jgi:2-hydroxy-6-oxonona-2,4-dienedioate hydrolase
VAEILKLSRPVVERPRQEWASIAVELLGAQSRIIQGERWYHHVIDKGDGPPLLLYHGIGGHAETYARTLPQLARRFHVYAVDALFHGYSSKEGFDAAEQYNLMADGFADLVHALGYERVHYEGESMGAMTGFIIGFRYPELVSKMVLNTGFYLLKTSKTDFKPAPGAGRLGPLSQAAVLDPSYEHIAARLHWLVAEPESITDEMVRLRQRLYQDPDINASLRRVFNIGGTFDSARVSFPYTEADCARWSIESLVLWGEHNPGHGPDFGEYCADLIGAKFYNVNGAGHWPQWEKPDEYSQVMIDFLTS